MSFELPPRSNLNCAAAALVGVIVMCLRDTALFTRPIHENSDFAANSILVNQAVHFNLLVGNYSREGFHHPGPAYLYLQSFGQDLFYSLLHIVPYQYNGQLLAVFILGSTMLALTARTLARHIGSWLITIFALGIVLGLTASSLSWPSAWMPYLYAAPFLLATVAGASVAIGALDDLPVFVFSVALLIHGHVSFTGIMGIYVLAVLAGWLVMHRGKRGYRRQLAEYRRSLLVSSVIVVLFALPIVVNLALHWPGQFGLYWHYLRGNSHSNVHTIHQVVFYVVQYWPGNDVAKFLVLASGVVAIVLALFERDHRLRAFCLTLIAAVGLLTLEVGLYALKGVDQLSYVYTGFFYYTTPTLLVVVAVLEGCSWARRWTPHLTPTRRRVIAVVASLSVVGLTAAVLGSASSFENTYRGDPNLPAMASAVLASPLRQGRQVSIRLADPGSPSADWSDVDGLLIATSRLGNYPCLVNPKWEFMMTSQYICTKSQASAGWQISVDQAGNSDGGNGTVIFHDATTVVRADT